MNRTTFIGKATRVAAPFKHSGIISFEVDAYFRAIVGSNLMDLEPPYRVQVTIEPEPDGQTQSQRNFFHKLCKLYGAEHNSTWEDVKEFFKRQFGVTREVEVAGERFLWVKSTANYTKGEYSALLDRVVAHMLHDGISMDNEYLEYKAMRGKG